MRWPANETLIPAWLIQILLFVFGVGAIAVTVWWPRAILLGNPYLAAGMLGTGFAAVLAGAFFARVTGINLPFLNVSLQAAAVVKSLAEKNPDLARHPELMQEAFVAALQWLGSPEIRRLAASYESSARVDAATDLALAQLGLAPAPEKSLAQLGLGPACDTSRQLEEAEPVADASRQLEEAEPAPDASRQLEEAEPAPEAPKQDPRGRAQKRSRST